MKKINKETKKKLIIFIVIYCISLIICLPFLLPHRITDTYWNIGEGIEIYKYIPLKDGRIVQFIILCILELFNIKMEFYTIFVHYISIIIYAISIYNIYTFVLKILDNNIPKNKISKIYKVILLIASTLIILNPLTVENFAYIDNITMVLSILIGTIAAKIVYENEKYAYIKTLLLIILAGLCYQGNLNVWIAISILYLAIGEKKNVKEWIKYIIKLLSIAFVTLIFLVSIINISNNLMGNIQNRIGMNEINIEKFIILFIKYCKEITTIVTFNYYPKWLLIIVIIISTLFIVYNEKTKPINSWFKYYFVYFFIMCACITPAFLQKNINLSARMINGIGAIIGVSIIYICYIITKKGNQSNIGIIMTLILSIIMFGINIFDYYNIAYMNQITMSEEEKYVNQINEVMLEYEKENNITLKKAMIFKDKNCIETYKNLPQNTFNSRGIKTLYSKIHCLNYYTGRNLKEEENTQEKYDKYFKDKDWDEFNKEQVQFEGDTVYICIY